MSRHRTLRRLAVGLITTAVAMGALATPAAAVDPIFYWQVETTGTEVNVRQGPEKPLYEVMPVDQPIRTEPKNETISGEWTTTDSTSRTGVLNWAVGVNGQIGALAKVDTTQGVSVEQREEAGGRVDVGGSKSTTVTRSSSSTVRTTWSFAVNGPPLAARRGFQIFGYALGNRIELKARHCTAVPGGGTGNDRCGEWRESTLFQPTGIGVRYQPLGWGDTVFSAGIREPMPKWISTNVAGGAGQEICPTKVALTLDVATSRYRFGCSFTNLNVTGIFTMSAIKDEVFPFDVDSFVAELRGDVVGKVRVTRERIERGSVRPLTMTSIGNITAREFWRGQRGTFKISRWEGS